MPPFAIWLERTRGEDAPGTRKVVSPGSPSPRGLSDGPVVTRVGAPTRRLRGPPRCHPTLPGTKEMPVSTDACDPNPGLRLKHSLREGSATQRKQAPIEAISHPLESSRGAYDDVTIAACPPSPAGITHCPV
jgi:hypothetical protein